MGLVLRRHRLEPRRYRQSHLRVPPRSGTCESSTTHLGGYSVVTADDLEAAVEWRGCPILAVAGGVEVGVLTEVDPDKQSSAKD